MYKTALKHRLNRQQKLQKINDLCEIISSSKILIISNYCGLTVAQLTELKKGLLKHNCKFKVVKNKLFEIALNKTGFEELKQFIYKNIGIIYSSDEQFIQSLLKFIVEYETQQEKFKILGGYVYNTVVDANKIKELSKLPSKEELIGKVIYLISMPLRRLMFTLNSPISKFLNILTIKSKS